MYSSQIYKIHMFTTFPKPCSGQVPVVIAPGYNFLPPCVLCKETSRPFILNMGAHVSLVQCSKVSQVRLHSLQLVPSGLMACNASMNAIFINRSTILTLILKGRRYAHRLLVARRMLYPHLGSNFFCFNNLMVAFEKPFLRCLSVHPLLGV